MTNIFTPESYGAIGDGITDDQAAFESMNAALEANNGGIVELGVNKTYRIGRQYFDGTTYLYGKAGIELRDAKILIVRMNGATLKWNDGLKFGTFDPATGEAYNPPLPFYDYSRRAELGRAILAENVEFFAVHDGKIDGNAAAAVIGGAWGDTGRQCNHYGIMALNCGNTLFEGVEIRDMLLDGFYYGNYEGTPTAETRPFTMRNCKTDKTARNGLSTTSNLALIENCEFRRAGEVVIAGGGNLKTAPASCVDVEAEGGIGGINRNMRFLNCRFVSGAYSDHAWLADSGPSSDLVLDGCTFYGSVWTAKPRTLFKDCIVHGFFGKLFGGQAEPNDNTKLINCFINDTGYPSQNGYSIDLQGAGPGVFFENVRIIQAEARLNLRGLVFKDVAIEVRVGTNRVPDGDFAILADGNASGEGMTIVENITANVPTAGYYILPPVPAQEVSLTSEVSGKLSWYYPGGPKGDWSIRTLSTNALALNRNFNPGQGQRAILSGDGPPAHHAWGTGTFFLNSDPQEGEPLGWFCTSGGTPGSWVPVGIVGEIRAASVPLAAGANPTKAEFDALITSLKNSKLMVA